MKSARFIRAFHRWSGMLLIGFVALKILTGYTISGQIAPFSTEAGYRIHFSPWVDVPLLVLFVLHASYGVLKILLARNVKNRTGAFVWTNVLAGLIIALAILAVFVV